MNAKFFVYLFVAFLVAISLESLNINQIFKKNRIYQARLFYILLFCALTYLVTNFIYDFINVSKFF